MLALVTASVARPSQARQQQALVTKETKHSLLCVSTAVTAQSVVRVIMHVLCITT